MLPATDNIPHDFPLNEVLVRFYKKAFSNVTVHLNYNMLQTKKLEMVYELTIYFYIFHLFFKHFENSPF